MAAENLPHADEMRSIEVWAEDTRQKLGRSSGAFSAMSSRAPRAAYYGLQVQRHDSLINCLVIFVPPVSTNYDKISSSDISSAVTTSTSPDLHAAQTAQLARQPAV